MLKKAELIMVQGDVSPPALALLTDTAGQPLNLLLPGTTVRFRMVEVHRGFVQVDRPATVLQDANIPATNGQVAFVFSASDTEEPGLYQAWFLVNQGNGIQHFPPDNSYFVLINRRF